MRVWLVKSELQVFDVIMIIPHTRKTDRIKTGSKKFISGLTRTSSYCTRSYYRCVDLQVTSKDNSCTDVEVTDREGGGWAESTVGWPGRSWSHNECNDCQCGWGVTLFLKVHVYTSLYEIKAVLISSTRKTFINRAGLDRPLILKPVVIKGRFGFRWWSKNPRIVPHIIHKQG